MKAFAYFAVYFFVIFVRATPLGLNSLTIERRRLPDWSACKTNSDCSGGCCQIAADNGYYCYRNDGYPEWDKCVGISRRATSCTAWGTQSDGNGGCKCHPKWTAAQEGQCCAPHSSWITGQGCVCDSGYHWDSSAGNYGKCLVSSTASSCTAWGTESDGNGGCKCHSTWTSAPEGQCCAPNSSWVSGQGCVCNSGYKWDSSVGTYGSCVSTNNSGNGTPPPNINPNAGTLQAPVCTLNREPLVRVTLFGDFSFAYPQGYYSVPIFQNTVGYNVNNCFNDRAASANWSFESTSPMDHSGKCICFHEDTFGLGNTKCWPVDAKPPTDFRLDGMYNSISSISLLENCRASDQVKHVGSGLTSYVDACSGFIKCTVPNGYYGLACGGTTSGCPLGCNNLMGSDGCSSPLENDAKPACNEHDGCYAQSYLNGKLKGACDLEFLDNMVFMCALNVDKPVIDGCADWAGIFYAAVQTYPGTLQAYYEDQADCKKKLG
ncbi:hypothetical protein HK098_006598 [Nowakowskiella sp. JEL0407]|nr:hypothetical protein HK098_006598 [Nowakowskiella sp. JEL0407]